MPDGTQHVELLKMLAEWTQDRWILYIQKRSRAENWEGGMQSQMVRCRGNEPRQPGAASERLGKVERKINGFQKVMQTLLVQDATSFPP